MTNERTRLSIVIPVHNGERTIEDLTSALLRRYGEDHDLEVVLVNDGSSDATDRVCRELHQRHSEKVCYLRLSRNFGEHSAVMAGLNHARGDLCVVMDDDFQNPPDQVAELIREIEKGYDVVYAAYDVKRDSVWRNLGSRLHNKMANLVLRKPADLYLSSFKIMNRFVVDQVITYKGPDPFLDAIILRATDNIGKVPIHHDARLHGSSGYTLKKLVSLWGNMVVSWSLAPIRLLGLLGLATTAFGLVAVGVTAVDAALHGGHNTNELDKLQAGLIFFRGVQLLATSLVGEYVGRLYLAFNSDPQFIVREQLLARKQGLLSVVRELRAPRQGAPAAPRS